MSGSKVLFFVFIFSALSQGAPQKIFGTRKPSLNRYFLATSLGNWQHEAMITDGNVSFSFSGVSLALGVGLGYTAPLGGFSLVAQGQALLGSADLGILSGTIPNLGDSLSGRGLGFFGAKVDISLLARFREGVAWGVGIPFISTIYFKRKIGEGVVLQNQDLVQWGAFLDFRLKRGGAVFNPKMGFIKNLRQYFVSMDYQWHF